MAKAAYLGVDIGTSGIKIVQLENFKGQPRLITYGYAEAKFDIIRDQSRDLQMSVAKILTQVMQKARATGVDCYAAMPTFAVFSSIISLPVMSRRDLATAVNWEAKKFIPLPIEDMMIDHIVLEGGKTSFTEKLFMMDVNSILGKKKAKPTDLAQPILAPGQPAPAPEHPEKQNLRILLTAAPKVLVNRYVDIFKMANLKLLAIETEAMALARSLIGVDQENAMIVDIGSAATNICMIERGVPILNRGLDIGGYHISKSICDSLNVSFERAEQFKLDFGIRMQEQKGGIPDAIKDSLQPIINEIQYVFELYQNQGSLSVDRVLLSGGSAFLPNLTTYLTQLLHVPVYIGNPWDRTVYPIDLKPVLDGIGPQMAVAIGLAMRNIG